MTTPTTDLGLSDIQTEFGGANPASMSEYYRGGSYVPSTQPASTTDGTSISTSGAIRMGMFRGVTKGGHRLVAGAGSGDARGYGGSFGSLTPNTYKGIAFIQCITISGNQFNFLLTGLLAKTFFTSVKVVGPGVNATYMSADAGFSANSSQSMWAWTVAWAMVSGSSYTLLFNPLS